MTTTKVLTITGGSDIAEPFNILPNSEIKPGMVVSIDPENPGMLKLSDKAYDNCVAGVISGAGEINPGLVLSRKGLFADGEYPVAISGRVYCWADASNGSILAGDLLTTSEIPGYVMKVKNKKKAQGCIIGKAIDKLESGKDIILVLINLQ